MGKLYFTFDVDDNIKENADIKGFNNRKQVLVYIKENYDDLKDCPDDVLRDMLTDEYRFGDCWIRVWGGKPVPCESYYSPFSYTQLHIEGPGQHPGGKCYWITPKPDIMVLDYEKVNEYVEKLYDED